MKKFITTAALGIVMVIPSLAVADAAGDTLAELNSLKGQVTALMERVTQLEQALAVAPVRAATTTFAIQPIESRLAAVEESNDRQTVQLGQGIVSSSTMDWARDIKWKGDFRYRHQQVNIEGVASNRVRHRIRARVGLDAAIGRTLTAGLQIATGALDDPRTTNATLDDASRRKEIGLSLAYIDWRPRTDVLVTLGKQKMPWFRAGNSQFFDSDPNPEGVAFQYDGGSGLFGKAWGYWLDESLASADSNLLGAQFGYAFDGGFTLAAGYWDYGAIQDQPILNFSGSPAGNSTYTGNAECGGTGATRCYTYDYNVAIVDAQWNGKFGAVPLLLFGGYIENMDPHELNGGYNLGFVLGKSSDPGSWEFGALYQDVERDAQFAGFYESDFADGLTQGKGVLLQSAWTPVKNMTIKAAYYINDRSYDTSSEVAYKRLELDLNYKF